MNKKIDTYTLLLFLYIMLGGAFLVWQLNLSFKTITDPSWQIPVLYFSCLFIPIFYFTPLKMVLFSYISLIHEIGALLGGLLSGYSFSRFQFRRYCLHNKNGHMIFVKYRMKTPNIHCLMMPPDKDPTECPYRPLLLGGVILLTLLSALNIFLFFVFDRHVFAYTFLLQPTFFLLFFDLALLLPNKKRIDSSAAYLAFYAFPRNPSLRIAYFYINKLFSTMYACDDANELPPSLVDQILHHDFHLLEYNYVAALYQLKAKLHYYRKEYDEEKLCYETLYHSSVTAPAFKLGSQKYFLFEELTGECRQKEIEKYFDPELEKDFSKDPKGLTSNRMMYAYNLLYANNPTLAQKHYKEFEKIISDYPDKMDVKDEWDAIHLVQECKSRRDAMNTPTNDEETKPATEASFLGFSL